MKATKAFTLIELLVVIAIIAILAAILFPVFAQAKAAAKKTVAISNQKQIALGIVMYAGDVDDTSPMAHSYGSYYTDLPIELSPYIQKIKNGLGGDTGDIDNNTLWRDPMDAATVNPPNNSRKWAKESFVPIFWTGGGDRQAWGTWMASADNTSNYIPGRSLTSFPAPGDTFMMAETANKNSVLGWIFPGVKRPWDPVTSTWSGQPAYSSGGAYYGQDCVDYNQSTNVCTQLLNPAKPSGFHNGNGWVYGYADGHAKALNVMSTIGKGVNGTGLDSGGAACSGIRGCGPWTLDDTD